jgi:hypothetical protein
MHRYIAEVDDAKSFGKSPARVQKIWIETERLLIAKNEFSKTKTAKRSLIAIVLN